MRDRDTIEVTAELLAHTTSDTLAQYRERATDRHYRVMEIDVPISMILEAQDDLENAADILGDGKFKRALAAVAAADRGDFKAIPNIAVAANLIRQFLVSKNPSGWLYQETAGGVQPSLVTGVTFNSGISRHENPGLEITLRQLIPYGRGRRVEDTQKLLLNPIDVSRKTPEKVLFNAGLALETPELRDAYEKELAHFKDVAPRFAEQFRFQGQPTHTDSWHTRYVARTSRVILDLAPEERRDLVGQFESSITGEVHDLPVRLEVPVFDLSTHDYPTVRAADLTVYEYDKSLSDKLVLPESHRSLMDVLTTEIDEFTADFIEQKAAGNVILCQGAPGVGKTLTAEVYSEIIERPLYSLSTVSLGITPDRVAKSLQEVFARAKRWNAVLLLDEADVFVTQRGSDLARDAIVAEFLRVMEHFDGLMFMTTNLSNVIDEAILSRCAAIVPYSLPDKDNARLVWEKIAQINDVDLGPELIEELVETFPKAAPRDIKMLLRLVLRVSRARGVEIDADLFRRYAVFRSMPPAGESGARGELAPPAEA